jgi:hypothetical protein
VAEEFQEGDLVMDGCVLGLMETVGLRVRVTVRVTVMERVCEGVVDILEEGVTEELGLRLVVGLAV